MKDGVLLDEEEIAMENGGSKIVMETRLSPSFKDTKHGKYSLDDIITFLLS